MSGVDLHVCLSRGNHVGGEAEGIERLRGRIIGRVSHDCARRYGDPVTRRNMGSIGAGECVMYKSLSWHCSCGHNEHSKHIREARLRVTHSSSQDLDVRILLENYLVLVACWASYKMYRLPEVPEFDVATAR